MPVHAAAQVLWHDFETWMVWMVQSRKSVSVFRNLDGLDGSVPKECFGASVFRCFGVSERCFGMDGSVSEPGWFSLGVSDSASKQCFELDGGVSVFRNGVSEWMVQSRNGWFSLGVSGGVSKQCFGMDGSVPKQCFGASEWMYECFGLYTKFHNSVPRACS